MPDTYRVELSDEGGLVVEDQMNWFREDERRGGDELANRWYSAFLRTARTLCESPDRHRFAAENGKWHVELEIRYIRFSPWKKGKGWRILFTIDEEKKTVWILNIRHESRLFLHESDDE